MAAERNPSSVLLLRRAERNAVRDAEPAHPGGCRDALVLEVEAPDQLPVDGRLWETSALDASVVAHRDAPTDAEAPLQLAGADVERWAAQARGGRAQDARCQRPERQPARLERPASVAPCTRGVDLFVAQSCAAQEAVAFAQLQAEEVAQQDEAQPPELAAQN